MAETITATGNLLIKYNKDYLRGYIRKTGLMSFMNSSSMSVIKTYSDLEDAGRELNIPITRPLKGAGVGTGVLAGNEEAIQNASLRLIPVWRRNGVDVTKSEYKKAALNFYKAQRENLNEWSTRDAKYRFLTAMTTVGLDNTLFNEALGIENQLYYAQASAGQRNTFLTANPDRVLFGNSEALQVAGNYATSLANVTTAMTFNRATLDLAKAMAMRESLTDATVNAMRPMEFGEEGIERFVVFCGTRTFNRFKADMETINQNAPPKSLENVIFKGGYLDYNSCLIVEIPELDTPLDGYNGVAAFNGLTASYIGNVGAASAPIETVFLCGAQALAAAWGQMPELKEDANNDYNFHKKVGVEECRAISKVMFPGAGGGLRQHGMVTIHVAR
jgi:hypothetical protein